MSMASPTLRSSSSTVPGPSLRRSPISIRARPSTAETCTGTSNTASRSAAIRVVGPSGSIAMVGSSGVSFSSRLGSGILLSSLILVPPKQFVRRREYAARADIARHRFADHRIGCGVVAVDAAVRPFDAAIAQRDVGFGKDHQAALEVLGARDLVELFLGGGIERVVDPHRDMRRGDQLLEAFARQRRDFGEWFARDQRGRELA